VDGSWLGLIKKPGATTLKIAWSEWDRSQVSELSIPTSLAAKSRQEGPSRNSCKPPGTLDIGQEVEIAAYLPPTGTVEGVGVETRHLDERKND
jgi:hypothetical protein